MKKAIVVTTDQRGVFFGYTKDVPGKEMTLTNARNCIYWRGIKGFLALAESGPTDSCRVGPSVDSLFLTGVTSAADCTLDAIEAWEKAPW